MDKEKKHVDDGHVVQKSKVQQHFFTCKSMKGNNIWVLLGLGIAGIVILSKKLRKELRKDYGAFIKYLELLPPPQPAPPAAPHPLSSLTFAIKDIFEVEAFVTGFGNPDWERTHGAATRTAMAVTLLVQSGATCIGKTHMDEMAYSMNGVNKHYGTPLNPTSPQRVPGGSSSGSAVAVAAELVHFALGTDTAGCVRLPATFCGIFGFRPTHGAVSCVGVVPMAQSLDTVGWFARDPSILRTVGHVLLRLPYIETRPPRRVLIANDCFELCTIPREKNLDIAIRAIEKTYGRKVIVQMKLGDYIGAKIPDLKAFSRESVDKKADDNTSSLICLKNALHLIQSYEFKGNHEEWVNSVKPDLGHGISKRVKGALELSSDMITLAYKVKDECRSALNELLANDAILIMPSTLGPPPKLNTREAALVDYWDRASSLLSVASMSGVCQVSVPTEKYEGCPTGLSFLSRAGGDRFLLDTIKVLHPIMRKEAEALLTTARALDKTQATKPEAAEAAKEKGNIAFKKEDFKTAVDCYTDAIRLDSNNATYYNNRAAAYLAMYSFLQAESDCTKAIDLDKKNVKAFLRRGTAREFLGLYNEADEDFKQALVLEPTNRTAAEAVKRLRKILS